jgi:hypothetical protein
MNGLIATAGRCARPQDPCAGRDPIVFDVLGQTSANHFLYPTNNGGTTGTKITSGLMPLSPRDLGHEHVACLLEPFYDSSLPLRGKQPIVLLCDP